MDFCPSKSTWWLCALLAAAVLPASGQQSIIFSKPVEDPADKANSFISQQHKTPGALVNTPSSIFSSGKPAPTYDILPGSPVPAPISPEQAREWQRFLDGKKNWTLLTPEEILGVPTAEKILGLPEPEDEKNLSASERYLKRQDDRARALSATNALRQQDASLLDGNSNPFQTRRAADSGQDQRSGIRSDRFYSQLLGAAPNSPLDADPYPKRDAIWNSAFAQPAALPKPNLEQQAAMERFRAMMDPPAPEKPLATRSSEPVIPVPDPYMQVMPAYNPLGNTYAPLKSDASRPLGITPLSGLTTRQIRPAAKSESSPKLPPWMSGAPPVPGTQQRVF